MNAVQALDEAVALVRQLVDEEAPQRILHELVQLRNRYRDGVDQAVPAPEPNVAAAAESEPVDEPEPKPEGPEGETEPEPEPEAKQAVAKPQGRKPAAKK